MTDFAALETPLYEEPRFWMEPTDRDSASELTRQARFIGAVKSALPGVVVAAIPNAAKRGQKAINQAKKEGALWGFPDLAVIHAGRSAYLEFKAGRTKPAQHQIEAMNRLHDQNVPVALVRTTEGAMRFLKEQGFAIDG